MRRLGGLAFLVVKFFAIQLVTCKFKCARKRVKNKTMSERVHLCLKSGFGQVPLSHFRRNRVKRCIGAVADSISGCRRVLAREAKGLIGGVSLSMVLVLFIYFLCLPTNLVLVTVDLLFVPGV